MTQLTSMKQGFKKMLGRNLTRFCRHIFTLPNSVQQHFTKEAMRRIQKAIAQSEKQHSGEIRFAVEASLTVRALLQKMSAKKRAIEVFTHLHIWDTEQNNGVLIYLLIADHDFEILADRGINQRVGDAGWEAISHAMESLFKQGEFEAGVLYGIEAIGKHLTEHYPLAASQQHNNVNELSDVPVIL